MTAPWVPVTVCQRWVYGVLSGDPAITSLIPADQIYPNVSPQDIKARHMTHVFAGPEGGRRVLPLGGGTAQGGLNWDITAWEPDWSQQALEPAMLAVQAALVGPDTRGQRFRYVDGGRAFAIETLYGGPVQVPLEATPAGVWAPISERYEVTIRPLT